jgi:hypothetical protein
MTNEEKESGAEPSVADRLILVKLAIQKATNDALKSASAVEPGNIHKTNDPNASFHLGMELFGQEVGLMERNVQDKLTIIENELQVVLEEIGKKGDANASGKTSTIIAKSREELHLESEQLRIKIEFLRECSSARSLLDESITWSAPSLAPNEEPNSLNAAKLQVQAQHAVKRARKIVAAETDANSPAVVSANKILAPIQAAVRRQQLDLVGLAKKAWHSSVVLTSSTLVARESIQLQMAYDVLETFATADDNSALEDILRSFTRDLCRDVFQPVLDSHVAGKPKTGWTFDDSGEQLAASALSKGSIRRLVWTRDDDDIPLGLQRNAEKNAITPDIDAWKSSLYCKSRLPRSTSYLPVCWEKVFCQATSNGPLAEPASDGLGELPDRR